MRGEAPFVGTGRRRLVEGLVSVLDDVVATESPRWVSLEAPSAWGKTRVVHEFYKHLAARQTPPAYWPPTFLSDPGHTVDPASRKLVAPLSMTVAARARPEWAWLGISCSRRSTGSPESALLTDVAQLQMHLPYLEDRWRSMAPRSKRFARWARGRTESVRDLGAEGISMLIPGFSFLAVAGRELDHARTELVGRHTRRASEQLLTTAGVGAQVAADCASQILRIAIPGLPVIVVVEDLHRSDPTLVELLGRLVTAEAGAVMVVTTTWPGMLDGRSDLAGLRQRTEELGRVIRIITGQTAPDGVPSGANLDELAADDRASVVRFCLPDADDATVELIANRFANPLAIQLLCGLDKVRRRVRNGVLHLEPDDISTLPHSIQGLLRETWEELPEQVKYLLALSSLSTPVSVNPAWAGGDDRWHDPSTREAIAATHLTELGSAAAPENLDVTSQSAVGWVRSIDERLRRFVDVDQREVAEDHARAEFLAEDITRFRTELSTGLRGRGDELNGQQRQHWARAALTLHAEGLPVNTEDVVLASLAVLDHDNYLQPDERLRIAECGLDASDDVATNGASVVRLRHHRADALGESGRSAEAIDELEQLVALTSTTPGATTSTTRRLGASLAHWTIAGGRIEIGIARLESLLPLCSDDEGAEVSTRKQLAVARGMLGQLRPATTQLTGVLADELRLYGSDSLQVLTTRHNLAALEGEAGRVGAACREFAELVDDLTRVLGPDHPSTLAGRESHAHWVGESGRVVDALALLEELVVDRSRILGPHHPATLATRTLTATLVARWGRIDEALERHRTLLGDLGEVLDADNPQMLVARFNVATSLASSGQLQAGLTEAHAVLAAQRRLRGPHHPETLAMRRSLATMTIRHGETDRGLRLLGEVLGDQVTVLGSRHPHTLSTRRQLANAMATDHPSAAEAAEQLRELIDDMTASLGPDHPETVAVRIDHASMIARAGDVASAVELLDEALADHVELCGPEHPNTLVARHNIAHWTAELGDWQSARMQLERLVADQRRIRKQPAFLETFASRSDLARAVAMTGDVTEAVSQLQELIAEGTAAVGAEHPYVLGAHDELHIWVGVRTSDRGSPTPSTTGRPLADGSGALTLPPPAGEPHPSRLPATGSKET